MDNLPIKWYKASENNPPESGWYVVVFYEYDSCESGLDVIWYERRKKGGGWEIGSREGEISHWHHPIPLPSDLMEDQPYDDDD